MSRPALEVITFGTDSSGRALRGTRQMVELHVRANDLLGGLLVAVQGAFNVGVSASAGTHDKAGCWDWRTWNLTRDQTLKVGRFFRDNGLAYYLRTAAEGFDPHAHGILGSDAPMHPATLQQWRDYVAGLNALASRGRDTFPYRPSPLVTVYDFQGKDEPEMALSKLESERLEESLRNSRRIKAMLARHMNAEDERAVDLIETLQNRHDRELKQLAGLADLLGELEREVDKGNVATLKRIRGARAAIITRLRDEPDTDGTPDNPSDEGLFDAREAAK